MSKEVLRSQHGCIINQLYAGAEGSVNESNVISVDFQSPDLLHGLMDDISAMLEEPHTARVAEPVLRDALQLIAARLLIHK